LESKFKSEMLSKYPS